MPPWKALRPEQKLLSGFWLILLAVFLYAQYSETGLLHRMLIDHDDHRHILPLDGMSLATYLQEWLPNRDNFAFPLHDLTYAFTFWVFHAFGVKTLWLTNLLLFLAFLFLFDRISKLYLPAACRARGKGRPSWRFTF